MRVRVGHYCLLIFIWLRTWETINFHYDSVYCYSFFLNIPGSFFLCVQYCTRVDVMRFCHGALVKGRLHLLWVNLKRRYIKTTTCNYEVLLIPQLHGRDSTESNWRIAADAETIVAIVTVAGNEAVAYKLFTLFNSIRMWEEAQHWINLLLLKLRSLNNWSYRIQFITLAC